MHDDHRFLALAAMTCAMACALTACPKQSKPPGEVRKDTTTRAQLWSATVKTPLALNGVLQIKGTASMGAASGGSTTVTLKIENALAGAVYSWGVHRGRCRDDDRGLFGSVDSYKAITVGGDGRASGSATVLMTPTSGADYFVSASSTAGTKQVVACGDLTPTVQ